MKDIFDEKDRYELEMSPEQTDFLWFLDQCGFDAKVRALRHTDVFDRVRGLLMHKKRMKISLSRRACITTSYWTDTREIRPLGT